ncbi:MAG: hypothetical protein M5U13_14235 [Thermoanaerobaculia bacterium]|nr:hypothetical protein [Thermoanaerobaculia bacterium]
MPRLPLPAACGAAFVLTALAALALPAPAAALTDCEMRFDMKGWSAFYRTASGEGTITCTNGQRAEVRVESRGGGVTFGRRQLRDATGKFTSVADIRDLFGAYAQGEAHAGAGKSSAATVVTKGDISLAIAGTGTGVDVGIAFGRFEIIEVKTHGAARKEKDQE